MLLSPLKFFIFQAVIILLIAIAMFITGKSCIKNRPDNYFFFSIKIVALAVLGALLLFVISTTINPKFTLSLMRDYWRLEMVEGQIGYKQYEHELRACLGVKPNCARVVACTRAAKQHFYPEWVGKGHHIPVCDKDGNYVKTPPHNGG